MYSFKNHRPVYPNELYHHGIKGQSWGVMNGPPYPLDGSTHNKVVKRSKEERKAEKLAKKAEKAKSKQEAKQLKADTKLYNKTLNELERKGESELAAYNKYRSSNQVLAMSHLTRATAYIKAEQFYKKSVSVNNVRSMHKNFLFTVETPTGLTATVNFNDLNKLRIS